MKKMLFILCLGPLLFSSGLLAQEQIQIYGAGHFTPPEAIGTSVTVVAFLEPPIGFSYPFSVDFDNYEYTVYFQTTITSITYNLFSTDYTYSGGAIYIYEDASGDGDYGTFPPNGTSPSTFQNGALILGGTLSNMERYDDPFGFLPPTMVAECDFSSGTRLGELAKPDSWTMHGGLDTNPLMYPAGYQQAWTMKIFFDGVVSTESSTWGSIKALFADR